MVYAAGDHETLGQAVLLNTDLVRSPTTRDNSKLFSTRRSLSAFIRATEVYLLVHIYILHPGLESRMMADPLFRGINMTMVELTMDSAFALTNYEM